MLYILCVYLKRKWQYIVMRLLRLRVVNRLKCLMLAIIKLFYYMLIAAVRACRAVFIQMWYKHRIQALIESVHSLSR